MLKAKIDSNQRQIVKELRQIPGISVEVGHDDILVGHRGKTYWYEIKSPDTVSPKTGGVRPSEITDSEKKRHINFKGHYEIVWNIDQILAEIF